MTLAQDYRSLTKGLPKSQNILDVIEGIWQIQQETVVFASPLKLLSRSSIFKPGSVVLGSRGECTALF